MNLENGKISAQQLTALSFGFILGSSVILPPGQAAGNGSWLAIFLGAGEAILFALIFTTLAQRFPSKTAVEINLTVYGPYLGALVSVLFLWYIFDLGSIVTTNFVDFINTAFLPETPVLIISITTILVSALAVYQGVEVIALCSMILVSVTSVIFMIDFIVQIKDFNFQNFLPFFDVPVGKFLTAIHGAATFPFGESVAFLMVFPYLNRPKLNRYAMIISILAAAALLSLAAIRTLAVLGNTVSIYTYPTYEALKLLNIPYLNTRMEIVVALNFMTMGFLKVSVLYYGTVLGLAQLFQLRSYQVLIWPVGALMVIFSNLNFNNIIENMEYARVTYQIYALPFELLFPLITLGIAMLRHQGGGNSQ